MTPFEAYTDCIAQDTLRPNAIQHAIMQHLNAISTGLSTQRTWFKQRPHCPGAYLWGTIGSGKSTLLRLFYEHTPIQDKQFWQTSDCLKEIQMQLEQLRGYPNPIIRLARQWAQRTQLICLDEFEITDITSVMLLGPLILEWLAQGVCLAFTSNQPVDQLYLHGLQRRHLIPTLHSMSDQLTLLHLPGDDYRLTQHAPGHFLLSTDAQTQAQLQALFDASSTLDQLEQDPPISEEVHHTPWPLYPHAMPVIARTSTVAWVDFKALCGVPRCAHDYPLLATQLNTLIISDVPQFPSDRFDLVTNFIALIDALYPQPVTLVLSAAVPIDQLCTEGKMAIPFKRTASRLHALCHSN